MDIRPIDGNALVARLSKIREEIMDLYDRLRKGSYERVLYYGKFTAINEAIIDIKRDVPTLDYVPKQQWISVKDRLPTDPRFVLVYVKHPAQSTYPAWSCIMTDMFLGDRWAENADEEVHEVTHWMPLPEPPKEG